MTDIGDLKDQRKQTQKQTARRGHEDGSSVRGGTCRLRSSRCCGRSSLVSGGRSSARMGCGGQTTRGDG